MSQLTDLQPTIFYASCTLKGILWLPWYFVPELFLFHSSSGEDDMSDEEWAMGSGGSAGGHDGVLVQDHHVLFWERICHATNIFALVSILLWYGFNPRLWQYQYYGWFLLALLVCQHLPQQVVHELGGLPFSTLANLKPAEARHYSIADDDIFEPELDEEQPTEATASTGITTGLDILQTNRLFSTLGVLITQIYCLVLGYEIVFKRLTAEPIFVFSTLLTILLETHITFVGVWVIPLMGGADQHYHMSSVLPKWFRISLCVLAIAPLAISIGYCHKRFHKQQSKLLFRQLKTINTKPKMKFV